MRSIAENSAAYKEAKEAVVKAKKAENKNFDESSMGMAALDITIVDPAGNPVEPAEGAEVSVSLEMKELPENVDESVLRSTMEIQHLNESSGTVKVETVAEAKDVAVEDGSAKAEFTVTSFSTFTLTWEDGSATIHYGYQDTDTHEFVDFTDPDKVATLDTSVASVSLENTFEGYSFIGATYKASSSADEYDMTSPILTRTENGWQITHKTSHEDDAETITENVANNSDIYVYYGAKSSHDPTPTGAEVPKPITEKNVQVNDDGTATVTLDITGTKVTETDSVGANVLIILDRTYSMAGSMPGASSRWAAARSAINTLVTTLSTGENAGNDIDYSLVSFYRVADNIHTWGSDAITGRTTWTKNATTFNNYVQNTLNYNSNMRLTGTNWESGLYQAISALNSRDSDQTYVIFLTDGEPNRSGTGNTSTSVNTAQAISAALPRATTIAELQNVSLYGVFCGSDSGHDNLADMIEDAGGVQTINGTDSATLTSAFEDIAHTIVTNLGATGVSVDDGVTDLSSVSATVHGTTGGYKYYYKPEGATSWTEWTAENGAPGATYSEDNGVTWDLSNVGPLAAGTTYRIQFTVWPSQEALDIIADLNNRVIDIGDLDSEIADQIDGDATTGYTLKTNTHLNTTYSFKGNTYTDPITPLPSGDMPMESELMQVKKTFAHDINDQDPYTSIEFYLLRDGKYYQSDGTVSETLDETKVYKLPVNAGNSWTNSIYIAPGIMKDGDVLETGHKYSLDEKIITGNEYEYEFTPQTVRPMEIGGTLTYLVLVDKYNPAPSGATTYYIDDTAKTYRAATSSDTENVYYVATGNNDGALIGTNRKTAELDITKQIVDHTGNFTEEQLDAETFTYRVTLTVPKDGDISGITAYEYVPRWDDTPASNRYTIFGYQSNESETVQGIAGDVSRFSGKIYGGYTVTTSTANRQMTDMFTTNSDGTKTATIDITLKRNEIIRFTNLPADTQYTIVEMYNNYRRSDPSSDADAAGSDMAANIADQGYSTTVATKSRNPVIDTARTGSVEGTTVTGTIDYLDVRYYNQFTNTLNDAIDVELTGTKHLDGYEWSGERYYFNLATTNDAPLPIVGANGRVRFYLTEASGTADKSYSFGKIRFTEAGTYTYTIQEDNAGLLQVVNGTAVQYGGIETITIVIVENGGKLSVQSVTNSSGHTIWDATNKVANTTITNTVPVTTASATKAWLNADETTTPPTGAKVTFALYADGTATGDTVELDGTIDENGETAAWVATFSGLQQYKIVNGEAVPINYTIGESVKWTGYDLVIPEGATEPYTVESGGTITNRQKTLWVRFRKTDMGTKTLSGAVFTFNDGKSDTDKTVTSGTDGIMATSATGTEGSVNEFELAVRNEPYVLTETTAPDGYLKLAEGVNVYVSSDSVRATQGESTQLEVGGLGTKADPYVVTIKNSEGTELPNTGGHGTLPYTLGGFILMISALMYGFMMRRRERRLM